MLTGAVNGVNTIFFTPVPYTAGTFRFYLNGKLKVVGDVDGAVEFLPATGEIHTNTPPAFGDIVQGFFTDTSDFSLVEEVTPISGVIEEEASDLTGYLEEEDEILGTIADCC